MVDFCHDKRLGQLVACGPPVASGAHYAIVASEAALARPAVSALVGWIEEQASK